MKPSPRACSQVTVTSPIRIAPISARELSSVSACVLAVTIPPPCLLLSQVGTKNIHDTAGNVALGDGSVQAFSTSKLREGIRDIGLQEVQIAVHGDEDERGC